MKILLQFTALIGKTFAYILPIQRTCTIRKFYDWIYSFWVSNQLCSVGFGTKIIRNMYWTGGNKITIGKNSLILSNATMLALEINKNQGTIQIGDDCRIGIFSKISSINSVIIGNNVTIGDFVLISDNAHGSSDAKLLNISAMKRPLYSKGPILIEDFVWIGDKVTILGGVRIGKGSIIGANSVVTKDVPANCVAAGSPCHIVKYM